MELQPEIKQLLIALGIRIQTARKRRRLRQVDLAASTGLSRSTIQAVERGDPACLIGNVFLVLWTLGLSEGVALLADPGLDQFGLALSLADGRRRVRVRKELDNDF
jgi:transcriptional regulator with XRE-family HTH domain